VDYEVTWEQFSEMFTKRYLLPSKLEAELYEGAGNTGTTQRYRRSGAQDEEDLVLVGQA
jgi:hypothetical protein